MYSNELIINFAKILSDNKTCESRLEKFRNIISAKIVSHIHGEHTIEERELLTDEYHMFSLFLYLNKIDEFNSPLVLVSLQDQLQDHLKQDREFRCLCFLMNWLEQIKRVDVVQHKHDSLLPYEAYRRNGAKQDLSLDPDWTIRTDIGIYEEDKERMRKILIDCFWLIRKGCLAEAQEFLEASDAYWQSLTIGGLLPYFDFRSYAVQSKSQMPSVMNTIEYKQTQNKGPIENSVSEIGNCNLELYLATCWKLSTKCKIPAEKAIYGSLCGNYDAMLAICDGNIFDHFWALIRTNFMFSLRQKLKTMSEKFQYEEKVSDTDYECFDMPKKIPQNWPVGFENIVRQLQTNYSYDFRKPIISLQFHCIVLAIRGQWDMIIDKIIDYSRTQYKAQLSSVYVLRFATHLLISLRENYICDKNKQKDFEEVVFRYIIYLCDACEDLQTINYYMKYIESIEYFIEIYSRVFTKFSTDQNYAQCLEVLNIYARDSTQAIVSQIIKEMSSLQILQITPLKALSLMKNSMNSNHNVENIIQKFGDSISEESLPYVLELIRWQILSCKLKDARTLIIKCTNSNLNPIQSFEVNYLNSFISVCFTYIIYKDCLAKDIYEDFQNSALNAPSAFFAQQKMDQNIYLAQERKAEQCRTAAMELETQLDFLTGLNVNDFPLRTLNYPEIESFKRNWWWVLISWLIEVCENQKRLEKLKRIQEFISIVFSSFVPGEERGELSQRVVKAIESVKNDSR
ncbi:hypothetical protein SteCoe_10909 [Stentor coeruleus]|uniref:Nuclear pore complex protein n=1 Tax=Stentor coeruleus TaxID=5963 RepID=A0A1R2CEG5_9CILI|nr:hypothetical protein SteCoe_10909 [Stentor coeruleus]